MSGGRSAITGERLGLLGRFIVYGLVGWCVECCFTSVVDLATGAARVIGAIGGGEAVIGIAIEP